MTPCASLSQRLFSTTLCLRVSVTVSSSCSCSGPAGWSLVTRHGFTILVYEAICSWSVLGWSRSFRLKWIMISKMRWWSYIARMPLIPGIAVGISPVAQMLLLPPLIFRIPAMWRKKSYRPACQNCWSECPDRPLLRAPELAQSISEEAFEI